MRRPMPQLPGMSPAGPQGAMPGAPPMGGPSLPGASLPPEVLGAGPPMPGMAGAGVSNLRPAGKGPNVRTRAPIKGKGGKGKGKTTKASKSQKKTMMAAKG